MNSIKKSLKKSVAGLIGISLLSIFASCTNTTTSIEETELQSNYGKAVLGKIEFLEKTINTVNNYIDVKSVSRHANTGESYFSAIGEILPDDLSTLKRKKALACRNLNEDEFDDEEISLKEELDVLTQEYIEMVKSNIPSLEKLEGLDDVLVYEDTIYLGGGLSVPLNTLEGIALLEYLIEYAETGNGQVALEKIKNDIQKISESYKSEAARSVYLTNPILGFGKKWENGVINYHFGDIYDDHKEALIAAMKIWEESCDNVIKFQEVSETDWNKFLEDTSSIALIKLKTGFLLNGVTGQTSQIGQCHGGSLIINKNIDLCELDSTCLHELGHVLGLIHEHQRADRDDYVVCETSVSYETFISDVFRWWQNLKFPKYLGGLVWKTYSLKILWWTIDIPYLVWSNTALQVTTLSKDFDFDSIMLYSGIELKNQERDKAKGVISDSQKVYVTKYNDKLSSTDIKTVKNMYK